MTVSVKGWCTFWNK